VVAVAQQFPNVTFCVAREEDYAQELRDLHLEDSSEDVNCALFLSRSRRFALPPEDGFSSAVFARFVSAVLEGRARPTLRSQSVRKSVRHETGVTSVVGLTFDQLVVESPKHVLLMFYAHWCAHCQAVAPVFRQVAEHYSGRADIEVAAIEGTQNDFRDDIFAEVNAFPAFYLLRANHKQKALKFESHAKPTLESLTRFVDETIVGARDEL
jgi:thiol-disulfide isomerase/thioredoxin